MYIQRTGIHMCTHEGQAHMCTRKGQAHTHVHIVTAAFLWCCSLGSLQESPPGRPSPDYSLFGSFSKHLSSLTSRLRGNCLNTDWSLCIPILSFSHVCSTPLCPNIDVFRRHLVSIYFSLQTGRGAQPSVPQAGGGVSGALGARPNVR